MSAVIRLENLSKEYRLGEINRQLFYEELQTRWARLCGRPDPNSKIDERWPAGARECEGHFMALRDVSFEVQAGEVVGIMGRNGAGKSTLLKILSQITAPTRGRVMWKGRIASLLEVGTGFHGELTGRDNVFLNGAILGMSRAEIARKFDEIVDFSGVEKFIDTPVKRYSSGMTVRLAFAVAASLEPEILVIDEVLAVGDAAFQKKCLGKMSAVARAGRTILFVSHQAAAVENLCSRGIILEGGQVVFDGTQTGAISHYVGGLSQQSGSLRERPDRRGNGQVRVVAIEYRDPDGGPVTTAHAGQDLEVVLHFENHAPQVSRPNLYVELTVKSELDVPVFMQCNLITGETFDAQLPARGAFVCRLRSLPLPSATFRLDYLVCSAPLGGVVLDQMDSAVELSIEGGDFFGSGQLPTIHQGLALVDGRWRLEKGGPPQPVESAPRAGALSA